MNFGDTVAEIVRKSMRERDVMGREKKLNFGNEITNEITKILAAQKYCPSECEVPRGKPIVANKLPKL